jgi:signal transduction histidine kinase
LAPGIPALPDAQAPLAYRVVAEALTNARRHGRDVTRIVIEAEASAAHLVLTISDDGAPRPTDPGPAGGSGLVELRRRVAELGGSLTAGPSGGGGGWTVRVELPLERPR